MIVSVSEIITRDDKLKMKAGYVNSFLRELCIQRNIGFIQHNNITCNHLNAKQQIIVADDCALLNIKKLHPTKLLIGHLNINSLRSKVLSLQEVVKDHLDILLISESKLDQSFTDASIALNGFKRPYRRDRNKNGGGLVLYVNCEIISNAIKLPSLPEDIEIVGIEVILRAQKWPVLGIYKPPNQRCDYFLENLGKVLDSFHYENCIIMGDFNSHESELSILKTHYNLSNLIDSPTCYKNPANPSCIDHIWVSDKKRFTNSCAIETGLSDWHKLTVTVIKAEMPKKKPRIIKYRSIKNFNKSEFQKDLTKSMELQEVNFANLDTAFKNVIEKHMPVKQKMVRNNHAPFITKRVRKEIMIRSRKRNVYNSNPTAENWNSFRIQRNKCAKIVRDARKIYYRKLDVSKVRDNKAFWKIVKPNFSEKAIKENITSLVEDDAVLRNKVEIANVMNDYFVNITRSLNVNNIPENNPGTADDCSRTEVDAIISSFKEHPSIKNIKSKFSKSADMDEMKFCHVSVEKLKLYIGSLKSGKACPEGDIPADLLKAHANVFVKQLSHCFNDSVDRCIFPESLKFADVSPLYKAKSRVCKENYRPVSKLPNMAKVFEKILFEQISEFMEGKMSPILSGFRKGYSSQHALLNLMCFLQRKLDSKKCVAALLMDLSKAFDCINHKLLIAKLHAYGFSSSALSFIWSYLKQRFQRVGIDGVFGCWKEIFSGIPQGSILGPLLFNIFLNDFLFQYDVNMPPCSDILVCNYADDNTFCASAETFHEVKYMLEQLFRSAALWFSDNGLQLNASKCDFIIFGKPESPQIRHLNLNGAILSASKCVELLGIKFDSQLTFADHINTLCKRASCKSNALKRISWIVDNKQKSLLYATFIASEFNYCPLVWGFNSRKSISKVDRVLKRARSQSKVESISSTKRIHMQHCRQLLKEVYKTKWKLNPSYMEGVFQFRNDTGYNLRSSSALVRPRIKSSKYGLQTFGYIASQLWNSLPDEIKSAESLVKFCRAMGEFSSFQCKCRICAEYIINLGII
ncbi:uncharacterized protein LOC130637010 [Hydractinia symbiolongicarpus]|uniref:uncharacterized protein LOC130637010 n=1 Tax=Hydractinia symbiolongicarpus TaxID=13093 RepID=UPI00254E1749|nr:uncharacterized protein LOC130637010 [Hydractinia symbiolongicarpus]